MYKVINFIFYLPHCYKLLINEILFDDSIPGYFCNNSTSLDTKENDQHAGKKPFSFSNEQNKSSSLRDHHNDINNTTNVDVGRTAKRALPSSLAESLRAVFAAFLWHEGITTTMNLCFKRIFLYHFSDDTT